MIVRILGLCVGAIFLPAAALADQAALLGNGSCATSTCHGNVVGRGPVWNHSLSIYTAEDPHAGAGRLLRDDDSRAIVIRLNADAASDPATFDNVLRARCISCHATTTAEQTTVDPTKRAGTINEAFLNAGVTCEACHGAAERWIEPHVQMDWRGPERFSSETGMLDTESVLGRAKNCVRCHIGSRSADGMVRDMNHDLIAAGHPALRFDLLIYNENLPKHWDTVGPTEQVFSSSPIRVRKVSRAINLATAATLSAERAKAHLSSPESVPWPEFSDYDCFACHQSLTIRRYDLPSTGKNKSPLHISDGLPVWNAWHSVGQEDLRGNRKVLEKLSPHRSNPETVASSGIALAKRYRDQAADFQTKSFEPKDSIGRVMKQIRSGPPADWHDAAVMYLEIDAALREFAVGREPSAKLNQYLNAMSQLERLLRFDQGQSADSRATVNSPRQFNPDQFREAVLSAFQSSK